MKKEKFLIGIIWALLIATFVVSIAFYPRLPEKVPSHWNAQGEVDAYMSRFWGTFTLPFIMVVLILLFLLIPSIDPLKENIKKFKGYYYEFVVAFLIFMLFMQVQILLWSVGIKLSINVFVPIIIGVLFYFIGMLLEKAKRNWFIGIRTPWTLSSDVVWDKTHKIGALLFKICGIISIIGALFKRFSMYFILIPLFVSTVYLLAYSYVEYQKENKKN
jgi:uncharacterized membrane protein